MTCPLNCCKMDVFIIIIYSGGNFVDKYEEKYGKIECKMGILPLAAMGVLIAGILIVVAVIVLIVFIVRGNTGLVKVAIPLGVVGAALVFYTVKLFAACPLECREKAIIVKRVFKDVVIPIDRIAAIQWTFMGANAVNTRAMRSNQNSCEIIENKHYKTLYKISDGYYRDVIQNLGAWQDQHEIPRDLESGKKPSYKKY